MTAAAFYVHQATPPGEGGIAVIELYGAGAAAALAGCFRAASGGLPAAGQARYGELFDADGELVDEVVLTHVPAVGMWSRLSAWTLSVHGGLWVQKRAVEVLTGLGGVTRSTRGVLQLALELERIDAIQARAYECLIRASTPKTARFFLRQYGGELSNEIRGAVAGLTLETLAGSRADLRRLLDRATTAERAARPLRVLIAGPPNAGKSTLFNRLVEAERAIVSPVPGTTRDLLEECISLEGYPVILSDSAGLRSLEAASEVERAGIERVRCGDGDSVLYLLPYPWNPTREDEKFLAQVPSANRLVLASLGDRARPGEAPRRDLVDLRIAALRGRGLDDVRRRILELWISPGYDPQAEIPCGPFAPEQSAILRGALEAVGDQHAILDATRSAYIECLRSSWPLEDGS